MLGRPIVAFLWALPPGWRHAAGRAAETSPVNSAWRFLTAPSNAFVIHSAVIWAWHIPRAYQASVRNDLVHSLQHLSFLVTALLFWWACIRQRFARRYYGPGLLYTLQLSGNQSALDPHGPGVRHVPSHTRNDGRRLGGS